MRGKCEAKKKNQVSETNDWYAKYRLKQQLERAMATMITGIA